MNRTSNTDFLKAQLDAANAQNVRLSQENASLRKQLQSLTEEEHTNSSVHIEAKLKAFRFEEERDRMYEKLEKIKRKYNQLHEAYLQKVKRCKAYEDVFNRQKTLNGLVMKSSIDQRQKEQELALERHNSKNNEKHTIDSLEAQVAKLQTALDEAYDIIDELEFELESVDFLEVENQRLRSELESYKKDKQKLRRVINSNHPMEYIQTEERETVKDNYDEAAELRQSEAATYNTDSNASSLADSIVGDMDPATIERAALTESLMETAEREGNILRRELLRSRLRKAFRPAIRPTSSDA
ncbi:intraflagellar transport protein 81 homolog [Lucilia sericata]|uniref:intraflagellar transport protein 81 homolog n=1 Tax=Lucilia sericata TaxID=13632 RepID=UPI0018A804F3|nr:intraflagellar transport protein 81 homolog [Lucilia sericata]